MAYTDLVMIGDRFIVNEPADSSLGLMPGTREIHTYKVLGNNVAVRISNGKVAKINRKNNGAVYIGRNPVIARA